MNRPIDISQASVDDPFWSAEQELVRTAVLPYQWRALNDQVPGASPSYCMHNFRAAAALNKRLNGQEGSGDFQPPTYNTNQGFHCLPEDPDHPDPDKFYGYVFQDTDFSKWVEAVGYSLAHHPDAQLERLADGAIDIVCAAQLDSGYLDTYYILNGMNRHFTNLKDHHELYCLGHLIEGAIAYYQGTGKAKLLHAAERFADYVATTFGPAENQLHGYPGHEIAEMALVRLYETTGIKRYLDLAAYFVNQRGTSPLYFEQEDRQRAAYEYTDFTVDDSRPAPYAYYQAHKPVAQQRRAVGHAVRAGYLYAGAADVARLTGDSALNKAVHALWRDIVDKKLYVTGGVGADADAEAHSYAYDLPSDTGYCETCASVALVFFARRMLQLEPRSEYADVVELALYNTVLDGMAMDGKSFFYGNPLEVRPQTKWNKDPRYRYVPIVRKRWFGCACCPPNLARLVESVQDYAYTLAEDGSTLFVHLYIGGRIQAALREGSIALRVQSELPWKGRIRLQVEASVDGQTTLALRLPSWAGGEAATDAVTVHTGQGPSDAISRRVDQGYLYLSGLWKQGDRIDIDFDMPVRAVAANPLVSQDAGKVAVTRGPIVYCAEERDNGANLHLLHLD
ncbi:MAG: glycoside hydrolase family 127 protein, partial [Bifidobacterium sp.]|nr:glycoside hydrolase family 127 protein [Bifidobacterium sp.]